MNRILNQQLQQMQISSKADPQDDFRSNAQRYVPHSDHSVTHLMIVIYTNAAEQRPILVFGQR
jgi:hypothetical protein